MKKAVLCLLLVFFFAPCLHSASITLNIPDEHVSRVLDAFAGMFERPTNPDGTFKHTKAQWAKKILREEVIAIVQAWEHKEAVKSVSVPADPDIVTE